MTVPIDRGGSKLEISRALLESGFSRMPRSVFLYAGESIGSKEVEIKDLLQMGPLIARGSNRADYHGGIDVFPTRGNITSTGELERFIRDAEEFMRRPDVRRYVEINDGQTFSPELHFLLQNEFDTHFLGQALENPHDGSIILCVRDTRMPVPIDSRFKLEADGSFKADRWTIEMDDETFIYLAQKFCSEVLPEIKETGVLDPAYAQQYEFDFEYSMFFQARPFKPFQEPVEFSVRFDCPHVSGRSPYGITTETGTRLETVVTPRLTHQVDFSNYGDNFDQEGDYGLYIEFERIKKSPPLSVIFSNMKAVLIGKDAADSLSHCTYRFMKKAELALCSLLSACSGDQKILKEVDLTYFSNGRNFAVVPTRYL